MKLSQIITDELVEDIAMRCLPEDVANVEMSTVRAIAENGALRAAAALGVTLEDEDALGLDAPTKLDVSGIYQRGGADIEAEQRAREAVIEALPIEEQRRIPMLRWQFLNIVRARSSSQLWIMCLRI